LFRDPPVSIKMSGKRKFPSTELTSCLSDAICQRLSISAADVDLSIIFRHATKLLEELRNVMTNHGLLKGDERTLETDFEKMILCENRENLRKLFFDYDPDAASILLERYRLWKKDEKWLATLPLHRFIALRLYEAGLCVGEKEDESEEREYTRVYRLIASDIRKFINERSQPKEIKSSPTTDHATTDKFNYTKEMRLLKSEEFNKGLEARIGLPATVDIVGVMEREHTNDSPLKDLNPKEEWDVVIHGRKGHRDSKSNRQIEDGISYYLELAEQRFQEYERRIERLCKDNEVRRNLQGHHDSPKKACPLSEPEVVGLRLWTGPMYRRYADEFRSVMSDTPVRVDGKRNDIHYVTTLHAINSGISKLASFWELPKSRRVYRGYSGMDVSKLFLERDVFGCSGGVEPSVLATTVDWNTAVFYSKKGKCGTQNQGIIFEIEVGQVDRGADISWLSQFPKEKEVLFNALSNLEVIGEPYSKFADSESNAIIVYPVRINGNLRSKTLEEYSDMRKVLHLDLIDHLKRETQRRVREKMSGLANGMQLESETATFQETSGSPSYLHKFQQMVSDLISKLWNDLKKRHTDAGIDVFNSGKDEYLVYVKEAVQFNTQHAENLIDVSISLWQPGDFVS
jgi:hypothetical protein